MGEAHNSLPETKKRGAPYGNKRALGNRGGGRKSKYKPQYAAIACKACKRGLTDLEIADLLNVSQSTLHQWKLVHTEFSESWKRGRRCAHDRVERSLFHRAVGYSYDEEKVMGGHRVTVRRHVPPDTAAAIFYLKNRRPERWRDVQRQEHGRPGEFDHIEDAAELRALLTRRAQELGLLPAPTNEAEPALEPGENGAASRK